MSISPDLQSMTGFASATDATQNVDLRCEIRSVNGKGLDVRVRLPDGLDTVEQGIKKYAGQKLARGNVQVAVSIAPKTATTSVRINEPLFYALADHAKVLASSAGLSAPSTDAILALRGVVVSDEANAGLSVDDELIEALMRIGQNAVDQLAVNRRSEGAVIAELLAGHITEIERLVGECATDPALNVQHISAHLTSQLGRLIDVDDGKSLDSDRLHMEAALLATKGDVREELDRITAHVAAARIMLSQGGAIGRKLDFLCQEFNRESNTLCAKASTTTLTAIGLTMKAVIDQMKEQAANIQ